jgi:tripartite-type tricarboxylate transporter receptor subunit TctC
VVCGLATGAAAQYPDRPIRLIVPQAAGSATDTVARILGAELGKEIGQQIVVDNRPGGALTLGLDLTAKAEPDGYTLCMGPIGALAITRHMVAKLPYNIERDFQPIALATADTCCWRCRRRCRSRRFGSWPTTPGRIPASCSTLRRATARPAMSAASCSST